MIASLHHKLIGRRKAIHTKIEKMIVLNVEPTTKIEDVRRLIQDREGIPPSDQRLVCGGKQLEDGNTLQDYSIQKNSTIYVVMRVHGGN